jgi:hypothetical protein|tara:strand:+ start:87 stop:584 length:498 start_codon:yes stop_codon:yes gene_type:complete
MSSKIEDVFDLPPMNEEVNEPVQQQETGLDLNQLQQQLDTADKIDAALPMVRDMETLDADMDNYANKAIHAFQDLMDLGQNVEDRHAANVFAVASTMMTNAITAKTAKMDKKLKMVQLQLQKAKFDAAENKANGNDTAIQGEAEEFEDRNALINAVINKMNNSDK